MERLRENGLTQGKVVVDCQEAGQLMAKSRRCLNGELKAKGTCASYRWEQHFAILAIKPFTWLIIWTLRENNRNLSAEISNPLLCVVASVFEVGTAR